MSVDIDIGGNDIDKIEDEDIFPEEEVVEVEEVEALEELEEPIRPSKVPPEVVKKPSPWVKRILVVTVVIVLIIVAIFAFIYFGTDVTNVTVALEPDPDYDKLNVSVLVGSSGMASVAGDADLEITYQDNVIYTSKVSINDDGTGKVQIPYNAFVEENGDYFIQVKYEGEESFIVTYEERYVVEDLNITAEVGKVASGGQMNVTVTMLDKSGGMMTPRGAEITIDEIDLIDDPDLPIVSEEDPESVSGSNYRVQFPYDQGGNYSIRVTVENSRVKPDSDYHTITETRDRMFLNILPITIATYTTESGPLLTYTAYFDAGQSWNDGLITLYKWDLNEDGDFDDAGEQTTGPTTSAEYTKGVNPDILLNIEGDIGVWDPIDQKYYVELGSIEINVNSP